MGKATDRAKTGSVTIATVRRREEARQVATRLEAAGIEWAIVEERLTVPASGGRYRPGGIKVQVDRSDAKRAIELLREHHDAVPSPKGRSFRVGAKRQGQAGGWWRTALEGGAILALATLLAIGFFLN
jgi:hypothetical protein